MHVRKPLAKKSTGNQRKEHDVEKYIQWVYNADADNTGLSSFVRLAVVASEIGEIPRNSLKIQTYRVQGHPRSSILVSIEIAYATSYLS